MPLLIRFPDISAVAPFIGLPKFMMARSREHSKIGTEGDFLHWLANAPVRTETARVADPLPVAFVLEKKFVVI